MLQQFTNNAASTLAANIGGAALSLTVATGEGALFPTLTGGQYFLATLCKVSSGIEYQFEVVQVTARSGDIFTIVRAQEGTTAQSYLAGDRVSLRLTAGGLASLEAVENKDATGGYAGLTLFKINFKNALNTFTSFLTNSNTAARTYTFPDYDATMATVAGTETLSNKTLTSPSVTTPTITGTKEVKVAMGANNIDLLAGNLFTKTISGATTLTVSNVPATGTLASFMLDLTNGGSAAITWWSGMKWAGGAAPTLTSSGRDVLGFYTHDGGTTWNGLLLGKGMA